MSPRFSLVTLVSGALAASLAMTACSERPAHPPPPPQGQTTHGASLDSLDAINDWMHAYLDAPDPERTLEAIDTLFTRGLFTDNHTGYWPLASFTGGVFSREPDIAARAWKQSLDADDPYRQTFVLSAFWLANTDETRTLLASARTDATHPRMTGLLDHFETRSDLLDHDGSPPSSRSLDMLWGRFLATGDRACVARIVDAASPGEDRRSPVSAAALWSLTSMKQQHAGAREALIALRDDPETPGDWRATIDDVLGDAQDR